MQWQFKGAPGNAEKGVNKFLSTGKWCFVLFCSVMLCYVMFVWSPVARIWRKQKKKKKKKKKKITEYKYVSFLFRFFHINACTHITGAPLGEGDKQIGRWHAPGSQKGWIIVETDNLHGLYEHASEWSDLIEWDVTPVLPDEEGKLISS
jgi:hypothetical protein